MQWIRKRNKCKSSCRIGTKIKILTRKEIRYRTIIPSNRGRRSLHFNAMSKSVGVKRINKYIIVTAVGCKFILWKRNNDISLNIEPFELFCYLVQTKGAKQCFCICMYVDYLIKLKLSNMSGICKIIKQPWQVQVFGRFL